MINSDRKSQSHNSKHTILSHNVLMSKLLGQSRWKVGIGETFNLSYRVINSDG